MTITMMAVPTNIVNVITLHLSSEIVYVVLFTMFYRQITWYLSNNNDNKKMHEIK